MTKQTDLYYVHLFNDFSGSPRVLRDAIESSIVPSENTYVFTSSHKGFLDGIDGNRISCFYARSSNRYIQLFYYLLSQALLSIQLFCYLLVSRLKNRRVTVVVNTMLPFGALIVAKLIRANVVSYVHETHIQPLLLKRFLRFFIEHCSDHVIFVSKYLQSVEPFIKPFQSVIYNGLRSDFPQIEEVDVSFKFSRKKLLFAGSLKEYKGINQLIELSVSLPEFSFIAALNCTDIELNNFIKEKSLPKNIEFIARPDNIYRHFEESFAVLNLSLPEGWVETFGLSLIEGMAYGSPVVAPPIGGPTEFVTPNNGLLVDAREVEEITNFLRYLNSSQDIWTSYSREAFLASKIFTNECFRENFKFYFKSNSLD